jgi:CheY-like chemotaxis protein
LLKEALDLLLEFQMDAASVVNSEGRPIGLLLLKQVLPGVRETTAGESEDGRVYATTSTGIRYPIGAGYHLVAPQPTVQDVMQPLFTLEGSASVARAAGLMHWEGVSHIAVLGAAGQLLGMLSAMDIAGWVAQTAGISPMSRPPMDDLTPPPLDHLMDSRTMVTPHKRVMVVDDDAAICESLVEVLEEEGFETIRALNGREALELLEALPIRPGLILLDLMMPTMSGWDFRNEQLENPRLRSIPVVVLTAHGRLLESRDLFGPAAILPKPIDIESLLGAVRAAYDEPN